MKGDRLLNKYFTDSRSTLRRITDNVEVGETLLAREIAERTGMTGSLMYSTLPRLEKRGIVQRMPFVWPEPPEVSECWGRKRWKSWRKKVRKTKNGYPGAKWRYLGFTVIPIDELLSLARLDLRVEACPS